MRANALQALADQLSTAHAVSTNDVLRLRQEIFPDGRVSRDEADALIGLEANVANSDGCWQSMFVEAIVDHVMQTSGANVDDATSQWLQASFSQGAARAVQVEAVVKVIERCDSVPDALRAFARDRLCALVSNRAVAAADVELMRRCLYAGDAFVGDEEARWLFAVDAATDGRANDPSWQDFFVKAQLNHLSGRQPSSLLDRDTMIERRKWLEHSPSSPMKAGFHDVVNMFTGGFAHYLASVRELDNREQLEAYYEAANANSEEDAVLTPDEKNWAVGESQADGKLTANERALLAALEKAEGAKP